MGLHRENIVCQPKNESISHQLVAGLGQRAAGATFIKVFGEVGTQHRSLSFTSVRTLLRSILYSMNCTVGNQVILIMEAQQVETAYNLLSSFLFAPRFHR